MGLGFIGSLMVIATLVVGLMGRAMESEFRVALMAAPMLGSSIVVLSMALVAITSGMATGIRVNTLQTRYMVSVCITLPMAIAMRVRGMKVENKVSGHICSAMVIQDPENGIVEFSRAPIPHPTLLSCMPFMLLEKLWRMQLCFPVLMTK